MVQLVGGGYLERYANVFIDNYIMLYRKLISLGINYCDIADPKIICVNDKFTSNAINEKLFNTTGKKLILVNDKHNYSTETIMYLTRNRLRQEFRKEYPNEKKVFFYFPIDDRIRLCIVPELINLSNSIEPMACMFKFFVIQNNNNFSAGTRPIRSWRDIHSTDWGGYCAYNILNEDECPLYPKIAIPNVAFYVELYKAGYKQYASKEMCIDHLRHLDSHHFKYKDTEMSQKVRQYLMDVRLELQQKGT